MFELKWSLIFFTFLFLMMEWQEEMKYVFQIFTKHNEIPSWAWERFSQLSSAEYLLKVNNYLFLLKFYSKITDKEEHHHDSTQCSMSLMILCFLLKHRKKVNGKIQFSLIISFNILSKPLLYHTEWRDICWMWRKKSLSPKKKYIMKKFFIPIHFHCFSPCRWSKFFLLPYKCFHIHSLPL